MNKRFRAKGLVICLAFMLVINLLSGIGQVFGDASSGQPAIDPNNIESPLFNEDGSVTVTGNTTESQLYIVGSFRDSIWKNFISMESVGTYIDNEGLTQNVFEHKFSKQDFVDGNGVIQYRYSTSNIEADNDRWKKAFSDSRNESTVDVNSAIYYLTLLDASDQKPSEQIVKGQSLQLKATRILANGTSQDLTNYATWSSKNTSVATVNAGKVTVADDAAADQGTVISAVYEEVETQVTLKVVANVLKSPVIDNDGNVTFNYKGSYTGEQLYVIGSMNNWQPATSKKMDKDPVTGVFSATMELAPNFYLYKFNTSNTDWADNFADPLNLPESGSNSFFVIPGIVIDASRQIKPGTTNLQLNAKYQDPSATELVDVKPAWSLKSPVNGVQLTADGKLTVDASVSNGTKAIIVASYNGYTAEKEIILTDKMYSYTINYYRYDGTAKDWNLWLFPEGANGTENAFTSESDGIAKGTYEFAEPSIYALPRLGDWVLKDEEVKINIPEGKESVEVWLVEGSKEVYYHQKPDFEAIKPVSRAIEITYVSNETDLDELKQWNVWVWNTGKRNDEFRFTEFDGNKAKVVIPIAKGAESIGFKMRKGFDWATAFVDVPDDRFIYSNSETMTKVVITQGQKEFRVLPGTSAPFLLDQRATFTYRDQKLFEELKMDQIEEVHLKMDGQLYKMNYVAEDERFVYTSELLAEGTHEYTFVVKMKDGTEEEVTDPKNTVNGKSTIVYKVTSPVLSAQVENPEFSYAETNLLDVSVAGITQEEIREIYADLTSLGGYEKTFVDNNLKKLTISVTDSILTGKKTLPVTVVDVYGNRHFTNAAVNIKTHQSVGKDDFDWDEARIYFMVTDRFRNGDESNDNPNGENYDKNHLETYHGGDLKGVTEKIPYLKDLGVNTIWITPIVDNIDFTANSSFPQYGYHGYWAKNFTKIDEHLGEMADFHELLDTAHDNNVKVMLDVVLNHTGYGMDDISGYNGRTNLPKPEERDVFNGMLRKNDEDPVIKNKIAGLPDFITEDPSVREQVIKWQTDWIENSRTAKGNTIDYFRVDTVKHVEDTTWMAFKNRLTEINPEFKIIGEHFGATVDDDGGYLRTGMMDSVLDFGFNDLASSFVRGGISDTEQALQSRNNRIDSAAMLGQFLSSHDENGFVWNLMSRENQTKFKEGTLDAAILEDLQGKQKIAASLQITSKGQPVIYYGEEVGHTGRTAGNMNNGEFNESRYDFDWDRLTDPTYNHIYDHYKKMLNIRDKHSKTFSKGTRAQLGGSDATGYDIFARTYKGESIVVGINTKDTEQQATFTVSGYQNATFTDEYSGKTYKADSNGTVTVSLPSSLDGGTVVLTAPKPEPSSPDGGGGGGSSYSTTPSSATPSPAPTPQVKPGTVEVAAKAGAEGRKIAEVSLANVEKAIDSAAKGDKVVEIKVSGVNAGEATDVVIPGEAVAKAGDQKVGLRLVFPDITVNIPATGLPAKLNAHENIVFSKDVAATDAAEALKQGIKGKDSAYQPVGDIYNFSLSSVDASKQTAAIKLGAEVSVTLTLDDAVLKGIANKKKVGVYAVKEDGTVQYVGGKLKDNTITFTTDTLTRFVVMEYNKTFSDVKSGWSKDYIELLAAKHIASGVDSERFNPKGNVTRAEFAAFLGRALGLDQSAQAPSLSDIQDGAYYAGYVAALNKLGIITGYTDGTFRPNQTVTREQITVMLMRAYAHVSGSSPGQISGSEQASFNDLNTASGYAVDSIKAAKALGIINGLGENKFQPTATSTREQVAAMIILFLEKLDL
ncbi:Beta/alpha-amylase precursor [compost metagenome]